MKYILATETGASILCKYSSTQKKSNFSTKRNVISSVFPWEHGKFKDLSDSVQSTPQQIILKSV